MRSQLEVAIEYAKNGIPVFPCALDKAPITINGHHAATTDLKEIEKWWKKHPKSLIASPSTYSVVLDIDDYNLCPANKVLVEHVLSDLKENNFFPSQGFKVKTMSGGTHVYFKPNKDQTRKIGTLPSIDLLGSGGYVILPDQKTYIASVDEPWKEFKNLPEFDMVLFNEMVEKHHDITVVSKTLKKKKKEEPKEDTVNSSVTLNYRKDEVKFEQTPNMYETSDDREKDDGYTYDGKPICISRGTLTEEILKGMFYNRKNQERMAQFLNVPIPSPEPVTFNSLIPNHRDLKPSMGSRWSKDKNRIIVRDFSNHYSDKYHQNDYNLVRLYTTIIYKNQTPRFSSGEFNMWFLRLLYQSGIIDIEFDEYFRESELKSESNNLQKVAEGFRVLTAFKKLYKDFDNKIIFADRFSAGWCGVPLSTANRAKQRLINDGYFKTRGMMNLSQKGEGEFFRTKVLEMII